MKPFSFAELIAPVSIRSFFDEYWERRSLHVERNIQNYYEPILSLCDLDAHLQSRQIPAAFVRVVRQGQTIPPADWSVYSDMLFSERSRIVAPNKLFGLLGDGATIALNQIQQSIYSVDRFCRQLTDELGMRCQVNLYLTPPHNQGPAAHYDTHDVLILQLSGRKRWRLYGTPFEAPTPAEPFRQDNFTLPAPVAQFDLLEGDALYLPRGLIHGAATTDSTSIHLTLGLLPDCWFELMDDLATILRTDPILRRALPHRYSTEAETAAAARLFKEKLLSMAESLDIDGLLETRREAVRDQTAQVPSPLLNWLSGEQVKPESCLCRRTEVKFKLEPQSTSTVVCAGHQRINIPEFLRPALEMFTQDRSFIVRELQGLLSISQKVELASRFVQAGLWEVQR